MLGTIIGVIKGDTRSLDYGTYEVLRATTVARIAIRDRRITMRVVDATKA